MTTSPLQVLVAIVRRDLLLNLSYRFQIVLRYFMSVMAVVFLFQLGRFVNARELTGYTDYFSYALIGYVFSQYFGVVLGSLSRTLRDDQLMGTIEPLLGAPAAPGWIALGGAVTPMIERTGIVLLQLALAAWLFHADFSGANWSGVIVISVIGSLCLLAFSVLSSAFVILFKKGDPVIALITAGSFMFTGVFFPMEQLPWWLRWLSYCLPVTFCLRGVRACIFQGASLFDVMVLRDVKILALFTIVIAPIGVWAFARAVKNGRRRGTLCHY